MAISLAHPLAPASRPRQLRRRIDRQLRRLIERDVCSLCGNGFKHNTRSFGGLDARGNIALAGECCCGRMAEIFTLGLFSNHHYDFLLPRESTSVPTSEPISAPSNEQIVAAIAAYQQAIAETDGRVDGAVRRSGATHVPGVNVLDHPWKDDDRAWFEQNRKRSHRARLPFPGEAGEDVPEAPAGHTLIVLVRQLEPGARRRGRHPRPVRGGVTARGGATHGRGAQCLDRTIRRGARRLRWTQTPTNSKSATGSG